MSLKDFFKVIYEHEIIRRYMVIDSFDGTLTIFGIIIASYAAGIRNPALVMLPSIGAAVAMFVSGIWGAYASESAEVKKKLKELEKHMLTKLHTSKRHAESMKMTFLVGFVDGISPLITAIIIIIPFIMSRMGVMSVMQAYYASMVLIAVILFVLGAFLGKIAKENIYKNGFKMILAGIIIAAIFYAMSIFGVI